MALKHLPSGTLEICIYYSSGSFQQLSFGDLALQICTCLLWSCFYHSALWKTGVFWLGRITLLAIKNVRVCVLIQGPYPTFYQLPTAFVAKKIATFGGVQAGCQANYLHYVLSFSQLLRQVFLSPLYRWGTWGSQCNLFERIQWEDDRQGFWLRSVYLCGAYSIPQHVVDPHHLGSSASSTTYFLAVWPKQVI